MSRDGLPTGSATAGPGRDVADPHPETEEGFHHNQKPGGANPPRHDIGPNPGKHDGKAPPRPRNAENGRRQ